MGFRNFQSANETAGEAGNKSEAWNVAEGYTYQKILVPMILLDKLQTIALYGCEDMEQEGFSVFPETIPHRRVQALYRFKDELKKLIENTSFIIQKEDKDKFFKIKKRIELVETMMGAISYINDDQRTHQKTLHINEAWFKVMFDELCEIKTIINTPINQAGLIFRKSKELTIDEMIKDIVEGG